MDLGNRRGPSERGQTLSHERGFVWPEIRERRPGTATTGAGSHAKSPARSRPRDRHADRTRTPPRARRRLAALGDWQRFSSPRKLFAWLGLTPSLAQSGESRSQGSITKTGSAYARRLLAEWAWHCAHPPRIGVTLQNRQQGQPGHVLQIAWRAQHRLHRLHSRMRERGKSPSVTAIAVARELSGFLWAAACAP